MASSSDSDSEIASSELDQSTDYTEQKEDGCLNESSSCTSVEEISAFKVLSRKRKRSRVNDEQVSHSLKRALGTISQYFAMSTNALSSSRDDCSLESGLLLKSKRLIMNASKDS